MKLDFHSDHFVGAKVENEDCAVTWGNDEGTVTVHMPVGVTPDILMRIIHAAQGSDPREAIPVAKWDMGVTQGYVTIRMNGGQPFALDSDTAREIAGGIGEALDAIERTRN